MLPDRGCCVAEGKKESNQKIIMPIILMLISEKNLREELNGKWDTPPPITISHISGIGLIKPGLKFK